MKKISRFFSRFIPPLGSDGGRTGKGLPDNTNASGDTPSANWQVGDLVLERYRIIEKMSGAMGHVFICEHLAWGIRIAIKAPRPEILGDSETSSRILREADAWIRMGMHPNIATCYYVLSFHGIPHLFIEYVNGGSLDQWIKTGRLRDLRNILSLAVQFCHGMEFTHSKGIIHRDIKPQNILITQDSLLKITDFGIVLDLRKSEVDTGSQQGKEPAENPETTDGFRGTPGYASPEQFLNTHKVDKRSDIFSFGLCLWMMLCGKRPFARNDLELPIPDPVSCIRDIELPDSLKTILKKCVEFDPDDRFQDFKELRQELNAVYSELFSVPCPFARLDELDLRAESLNNHAVSLFELNDIDGAARCLYQALDLNDNLVEAIFNLTILRWRTGRTGPATLIKNLEAVDRRLGSPDILTPLLTELKKWARIRARADTPDYPEFRLCLPPCSTDVYRENQLFQSVRSTIESHLKNNRLADCSQTLITSWKSRHFIKNRFYTNTYERLLKNGTAGEIAGVLRLNTLPGADSQVISLACIPDSHTIFYTTKDGRLITWDLSTKKKRVVAEGADTIKCLAVSPDRSFIASGSKSGKIHIIPVGNTVKETSFQADSPITAIAIDQLSKKIAAGSGNGRTNIYSMENCARLNSFSQEESVSSLLFLNDSSTIITGGRDGKVNFWQHPFQQSRQEISAHSGPVLSLCQNPDSRFFISTGSDAVLCSIENTTGRVIRSSQLNDLHPTGSLLLDDNNIAVTGGEDDIIELWDLKNNRNTFSLDARGDGICCFARGPRQHIFMAGCRNGKILLVMYVNNLSFP